MPLWSVNLRESSVRALTRPRCSSISGRSSRAIRRTSSRAWRTARFVSSTARRCPRSRLPARESSWSSTPVRTCPTSSCRLRETRARSDSWARSACWPLTRRSVSSRSSIWLKTATSWATSAPPRSASRWSGRSRSTERIRSTSRSIGPRMCRRSTKFAPSMTTRTIATSTPSRKAKDSWMRPRASASRSPAITSRAALTAKIRQSSGRRENRTLAWIICLAARGDAHGEALLAASAGRRRSNQDRHGRLRLEVADEAAAEVAPAEPDCPRTDDHEVGAFFAGDAGDCLTAVTELQPDLHSVAELVRDCRQCRGRRLLGAATHAVEDEGEHDSQPQPGAERLGERGGIPSLRVGYVADDRPAQDRFFGDARHRSSIAAPGVRRDGAQAPSSSRQRPAFSVAALEAEPLRDPYQNLFFGR